MSITAGKAYKRSLPGEFVKDFIKEFGITQYCLAKKTGIPHASVTRLLKGDARITANIAMRLGLFFGNSAQFWLNCQNAYDLYILEKKQGKKIHKTVEPYSDMVAVA